MYADSHVQLRSLRADGGMSASDLVMQIQADLLGIQVGTFIVLRSALVALSVTLTLERHSASACD